MSQPQGSRRRRGRGKPNRSRAAEFQARVDSDVEDRGTFWARSNARLGFEAVNNGGKGGPRPVVELNCAVCGVGVLVERTPKNRHEVRCGDCRSALGGLLQGDERDIADEMHRATRTGRGRGRQEGLPALSDEDREAMADMRARRELGNGQVGNRRRSGGGGGGGGGGRRRRGPGGGGGGGGGNRGGRSNHSGGGGNHGGNSNGNHGGNSNGNHGGNSNGNSGGNSNRGGGGGGEQSDGRRRRRRRRRGGEGDSGGNGGGGESRGGGNGGGNGGGGEARSGGGGGNGGGNGGDANSSGGGE